MLGFDLDLGLMFKIMGVLSVLIMIMYGIYLWKKDYIIKTVNEVKEDIWSSILHERELPVKDRIDFVSGRDILLYDIDLYGVDKKHPSEMPYEYHKLCGIVNKHTKIDFVPDADGAYNIDIELVDFRKKEYENQYLEIIDLVTNFNLAQFVFKGEETFKLVTLENEKIDKIKEHADYIISKMFAEVVRQYSDKASEDTRDFYVDAYKQLMFK